MLRFFRTSNAIILIVILFLTGIATWGQALLQPGIPADGSKYGAFLFRFFSDILDGFPVLSRWCGLSLTLLTAIVAVFVNNKLHLNERVSYLPALCYILLTGGVPAIHKFNPAVIATLFLSFSFIRIINSFNNDRPSYSYFTAPALISFAAFFYQYAYVYMLAVWFSILFMRPGYWREWVFSVLGFALPLFIAFSWFFLVDDDYTRMAFFFGEIFSFERIIPALSISIWVFLIIISLIIIPILRHLFHYLGARKIAIRNGYYILTVTILITLILTVAIPDIFPDIWYLLAFPLSFILSNYLSTVKSLRWGTVILACLFAGVFIAQLIYRPT